MQKYLCAFFLCLVLCFRAAFSQIIEVERDSESASVAVAYLKDQTKVMLTSEAGRVAFVNKDFKITLDDGLDEQGGKYLKLLSKNDRLYAFWWRKLQNSQKKLYFRFSEDQGKTWSERTQINSGDNYQVLPKYEVVIPDEKKNYCCLL